MRTGTLRTAQGVGWGSPIASASGAGGREPRALCGRPGVYARRQRALRTWASVRVVKISGVRPSSRRVPLHASTAPFSQGLPGSMQRVVPPSRRSQDRTAVAVNSGPVSERRELGGPCRTKRAVRRARTSSDRRRRAPAMLRHARVCASTRVRTRSGRPSCVRSRTAAMRLDREVCQAIVGELSTNTEELEPALRFAAWAARADYHWPLEVFIVNYDLVIETAFEQLRLSYFDGFVGNLEGRFQTDLVEGTPEDPDRWLSFVRLWKLHGSVNWAWDAASEAEIVRLGSPVPSGSAAAIYPSDAKYDESRRIPFLVLQDRFRRALTQPETLTLVTGYSFGDDHLNELLFDAAERRPRSEIIAFCYSSIPEVLRERAVRTPNLQAVTATEAILGGTIAGWEEPADVVGVGGFWDQQFTLGDFSSLSAHLARSWPETPTEALHPSDEKTE